MEKYYAQVMRPMLLSVGYRCFDANIVLKNIYIDPSENPIFLIEVVVECV